MLFTDDQKILTKNNLKQIKSFVERVAELNWVENVQSIFDVPLLEVNNQNLTDLINQILTIESPEINLEEAEKELLDSPIFKNLIISEDSTTTGVLVNFKRDEKYELLIRERDRLQSLDQPSKDDLNNYRITNQEYQISKKIFDQQRHKNINEIRRYK